MTKNKAKYYMPKEEIRALIGSHLREKGLIKKDAAYIMKLELTPEFEFEITVEEVV